AVQFERLPSVAQPHLDRERIPSRLQIIADDSVERGKQGLARRTRRAVPQERDESSESEIDTGANEPGHSANVAAGKPREGPRRNRQRSPENRGTAPDLDLHRLHDI